MWDDEALGNAGYVITGSGGGGAGGRYIFASIEELDSIITEWEDIRTGIKTDREEFIKTQHIANLAPAADIMSEQQAKAVIDSMTKARAHCEAMLAYAVSYIAKLKEARKQYVVEDDSARETVERAGDV